MQRQNLTECNSWVLFVFFSKSFLWENDRENIMLLISALYNSCPTILKYPILNLSYTPTVWISRLLQTTNDGKRTWFHDFLILTNEWINNLLEIVDICKLPIITGLCRAYNPSWGYNSLLKKCEFFIYGGCSGNDNRFLSEEDCKARCDKKGTSEDTLVHVDQRKKASPFQPTKTESDQTNENYSNLNHTKSALATWSLIQLWNHLDRHYP